jgi:hypothetical protein
MTEAFDNAKASLARVQDFDVSQLTRHDELGSVLNFSDAVQPATRLVNLFGRIPGEVLSDLPDKLLVQIQQQSDSVFSLFNQVLEFSPTQENAANAREQLILSVTNTYDNVFPIILPYISYGASRTIDISRIESESRAAIQAVKDQGDKLTSGLEESQKEAAGILQDVRKTAAEQGVSQQAIYFHDESESHVTSAEKWKMATVWLAIVLAAYSTLSLFMHKIPFLAPDGRYEMVQLAVSKVLIFAIIAFWLALSSRNFLSHKHNSIINKQRQNALLTYKALVDASGADEAKDIVLSHAASAIFTPQDTGYVKVKGDQSGSGQRSLVEMLPRTLGRSAET